MFILFRRLVEKTPYLGNLIPSRYLVLNGAGHNLSKTLSCFAVNCTCRLFNNSAVTLVLSQYDLSEAHNRFVKYYDSLTEEEQTKLKLGHIIARPFVTKRICATKADYWLVYLRTSGDFSRTYGYMFAKNEVVRIIERSKRLTGILRKPSLLKRIAIKLNNKYFKWNFELKYP